MAKNRSKKKKGTAEPTIENRRARYDYAIEETLECGLKLVGTEVKSLRDGQASLAEGWCRATEEPPRLTLHGVHISEYPNASKAFQHDPTRPRVLLAHRREIAKLAQRSAVKGVSLVPLKIYFKDGRAKIQIGVGVGKGRADKRQKIDHREARKEIDRAMSKRM